jgi:hypothetical protein
VIHFSAPEANCNLSQSSVCVLQRQILSASSGLRDVEVSEDPALSVDDGAKNDVWDEERLLTSVKAGEVLAVSPP